MIKEDFMPLNYDGGLVAWQEFMTVQWFLLV